MLLRDHNSADEDVIATDPTYIDSSTTGPAGDHIVGLDNFGRVADQKWATESTRSPVDEYQYGYDNDGNMLYKKNVVSSSNSELYTYDGLNRLTSMTRGTLNTGNTAITGTPGYSQSWNLDSQERRGNLTRALSRDHDSPGKRGTNFDQQTWFIISDGRTPHALHHSQNSDTSTLRFPVSQF